jgi:hypothetical protein
MRKGVDVKINGNNNPVVIVGGREIVLNRIKVANRYPTKSDSDIVIDVLKKENDCAADEIVRLSKMIVELGYDPSIKKKKS